MASGALRKLPDPHLVRFANALDEAQRSATAMPQLDPPLTVEDAYAVQKLLLQLRTHRGEQLTGVKLGFTSRAKMKQMGVSDIIWGRVTNRMAVRDGGSIRRGIFIHPRVEPEIAFRLARPLSGIVTREQALAAVEAVAPAIEVIDSRFKAFRFSLSDVIADNCSAAAYVVGKWEPASSLPVNAKVRLFVDGAAVEEGSTADILGDPLSALAEASRLAGGELRARAIVLAGAATAAVAVNSGSTVFADVAGLGTARLHFT